MNNVFYRGRGFLDGKYDDLRAGLRMNVIANPGVDKANFELWSFAVSSINGCSHCMVAHEQTLREAGVEPRSCPGGAEDRGDRLPAWHRRSPPRRHWPRSVDLPFVPSVVTSAWVSHAIWWQVYPLGFVGAFPADQPPGPEEHRLRRLVGWFDHAIELGASGIALGPIFASRTHGYDTTDHYRIDPRLGDEADFDYVVAEAHRRGLRVLLDGVFNHVGVDFPRYLEAANNDASARWFRGRPGRHSGSFETFEGHGELITLNHDNPDVIEYTADVMAHWLGRGADGWRLDAAYAVPQQFWAATLPTVRERYPDAWFVGRADSRRLRRGRRLRPGSTRPPSTSCGRRSGAASMTATSSNWTGRCSGTTNFWAASRRSPSSAITTSPASPASSKTPIIWPTRWWSC